MEHTGVIYNPRYYTALLEDLEAEIDRLRNLHFGEGTTAEARRIVADHIDRLLRQKESCQITIDGAKRRDMDLSQDKSDEDWIAQREEATEKTIRLLVEVADGRREGGDAVVTQLRRYRDTIDQCDEMLAAGRRALDV